MCPKYFGGEGHLYDMIHSRPHMHLGVRVCVEEISIKRTIA